MIEFRQKVFFLNAVMAAGTVIGIGQASSQMKQTEEQMRQEKQLEKSRQRFEKKQQEEQLKAQKEQQEKQLQLQREQMKQQRELQREGNTMAAVAPSSSDIQSMAEKGFSMVEFKRKKFGAVWNWQNIKGLAKDTGKILTNKDNLHYLGGMTVMGVGTGIGALAVNKLISNDMKRSGINVDQMRRDTKNAEIQQQQSQGQGQQISNGVRTYSAIPQVMANVGNGVSRTWKLAKKNGYVGQLGSGLAFGAAFGAIPAIGYLTKNKQQLQQQYGNGSQMQSQTQPVIPNGQNEQRQYAAIDPKIIGQFKPFSKEGWKNFFSHPVRSILGGISHLSQGGGIKGVNNVARQYQNQAAQSGNVLTQKVGNFLQNNKKTALAASIPVGLGIMTATWDGGEKVVKGIGKRVDPNTYAYDEWKDKQIE